MRITQHGIYWIFLCWYHRNPPFKGQARLCCKAACFMHLINNKNNFQSATLKVTLNYISLLCRDNIITEVSSYGKVIRVYATKNSKGKKDGENVKCQVKTSGLHATL